MKILQKGSFVSTDNSEHIERLKNTAVRLAKAADEKGSSEDTWDTLGLDFFRGLEYVYRDNEESAIRNLFVLTFTGRLRDLKKSRTAADSQNDRDEDKIIAKETKAVIEENARLSVPVVSDKPTEIENTTVPEKLKTQSSQAAQAPYDLEKCTVTAVFQMLPREEGRARNVVLSIRTHDFPPQISVHELSDFEIHDQLTDLLDKQFDKYRTDLPTKVTDRLRKEKKNRTTKKLIKNSADSESTAQGTLFESPEEKA